MWNYIKLITAALKLQGQFWHSGLNTTAGAKPPFPVLLPASEEQNIYEEWCWQECSCVKLGSKRDTSTKSAESNLLFSVF